MSTVTNFTTALTLPPIAILASAAAELVEATTDRAEINSLNKAALMLHAGVAPTPTSGGFLIESRTRALVHRISTLHGCGCEAGSKNKACWHAALIRIIERAQTRTMPTLAPVLSLGERIALQRRAQIELDECFA